MTPHEITQVRKSGHLQEALEEAEKAFAVNSNIYYANALFWCLNDLAKQQGATEASATLERMKTLCTEYCNGDELMQKAIASLSRRTLPGFQELMAAIENGRHGQNISSEYRRFSEIYKNGDLDTSLYSDFGWLIYYALKQTPVDNASLRKTMLHEFLALELPKPSVLHSRILGEAIKVEQNTPLQFRIRDFIRLWGLDNLRDEDWQQFHTDDGKVLPSAVEKLIGVYAKELKTDHVEAPEDFSLLVDKALEMYPSSQNMPYFKATVLISQNRKDEALSYYRDLILRFPSKFYLWNQTAELVDDADTKLGLLCRALTCGTKDEFLGGVRLRLAALLIQRNMPAEAKCELERYRQTYQEKGWNLKHEFWQMYSRVASVEAVPSNDALYKECSRNADGFIYSSLPVMVAVKVSDKMVDDRMHPGRKFPLWTFRVKDGVLRLKKPSKFGLGREKDGTVFLVRVLDEKIVWIKRADTVPECDWLKEASGEIRIRSDRKGRRYALLEGSYIGERLLAQVAEGDSVSIVSVRQEDGRWSAVSLRKLSR